MPRISYVNGRYLRHDVAAVHVEDRGYQFADGVYEVIAVQGGELVDEGPHFDRLDRSLGELRIVPPMSRRALGLVMRQVLRRNRLTDGMLYLQITRGTAPRDHAFPADTESSLVITARRARSRRHLAETGVRVITLPDIRWKRCDIKSVALLPNVLAKEQALAAGAFEAWMVDESGLITEGTASNAWIVNDDGELITRDAGHAILSGIARLAVRELAAAEKLRLVERPFSVEEAKSAKEAFLTSTTSELLPVVRIDDDDVGDGQPGTLSRKLAALYRARLERRGARP